MPKPQDVKKAREILKIPEDASLNEIKLHYRNLLKKWHPDKQQGTEQTHDEKTREIIWAYNVILEYCSNYRFSFSDDEIERQLSDTSNNWWMERFGKDPLWGRSGK